MNVLIKGAGPAGLLMAKNLLLKNNNNLLKVYMLESK